MISQINRFLSNRLFENILEPSISSHFKLRSIKQTILIFLFFTLTMSSNSYKYLNNWLHSLWNSSFWCVKVKMKHERFRRLIYTKFTRTISIKFWGNNDRFLMWKTTGKFRRVEFNFVYNLTYYLATILTVLENYRQSCLVRNVLLLRFRFMCRLVTKLACAHCVFSYCLVTSTRYSSPWIH